MAESTVERITVAVGTHLRDAQRQAAAPTQRRRLPPPPHKPRRIYVSLDGLMTPLRDPWKRDGSLAKLNYRFGECKLAAIYEAIPGPKGDEGVRRCASVASMEGVETFAPLVSLLAQQSGYAFAGEKIVLADGAAWIWTLAARQFPDSIEIVDFFHASEHLWTVARACFGCAGEAAKAWVHARQAELLADDAAAVLRAIAAWEPRTQADCDLQATEYGYFERNQHRMQYGSFRAKGYHIGSGVMEAGCKQVIGSRLDQAGMHWRPEVADAVVTLRAALRSTQPPDLRPYLAMAA